VDINAKFTFDDSKLKELQRKIKSLEEKKRVPLPDLLTDDFIRKYTDFQTLQAMLDASGIENKEDIGNEEFSKFVATHSRFSSWEEMLNTAGPEYFKRQLGL
jgi:SPX domain protein involved in polyphosphate accumulation